MSNVILFHKKWKLRDANPKLGKTQENVQDVFTLKQYCNVIKNWTHPFLMTGPKFSELVGKKVIMVVGGEWLYIITVEGLLINNELLLMVRGAFISGILPRSGEAGCRCSDMGWHWRPPHKVISFTFFKLISIQYLFACFKMCWKVFKALLCVSLFSKVTPCLRVRVRMQGGRQRSLGQCFPVISAVARWDYEVTIHHVFISRRL